MQTTIVRSSGPAGPAAQRKHSSSSAPYKYMADGLVARINAAQQRISGRPRMQPSSRNSLEDRIDRALRSYDQSGVDKDLEDAIKECLPGATLTSSSTLPTRTSPSWTIVQARCHRLRFDRDGSQDDIDTAKRLLESLVEDATLNNTLKVEVKFRLGEVHSTLFDAYCLTESIEQAHTLYTQALACNVTRTNIDRVDEIKYRLATSIIALAAIRLEEAQFQSSLTLLHDIINRRTPSDPLRVLAVWSLSDALYQWYIVSADKPQTRLLEAEKYARDAVSQSSQLRHRPYMLSTLSNILKEHCALTGSDDLIHEAAEVGQLGATIVLQQAWLKNISRRLLNEFGDTLRDTRRVSGRLNSMQQAAYYQRLALTDVHPPSRLLPYARCAMKAVVCFCNLHEEGGDPKHVDDAIAFGYEALKYFPEHHEQKLIAVAALGWAYALRYSQDGDEIDFQHAANYLEKVLERTKGARIDWEPYGMPALCRNLGFLYTQKYKRDRRAPDLDRAIYFGESAVESDPLGPRSLSYLSNLSERLLLRYELKKIPSDLNESIAIARASLAGAGSKSYQRHGLLVRYGHAMRKQFEKAGNPDDIQEAINCIMEALEKHPNTAIIHRTSYLSELAAAYRARYNKFGERADLLTALDTYEIASTNLSAPIRDRIDAAVGEGELAYRTGCMWAAAKAYCVAVALLPRLVGLNTRDRQKRLTFATGAIACNAAAASLEIGIPEHSIELLEHGRSMIWKAILELRTPLQELQVARPDLARELLQVAQALEHDETAAPEGSQELDEERAQRRRRAAERWEDLIEEARQIDGFSNFLYPPRYDTLQEAARDGPVVIINVSEYRTDALIMLDSQPIRCIPLGDLPDKTINALAFAWHEALKSPKDRDGVMFVEQALRKICRRLWEGGFSKIAAALDEVRRARRSRVFRAWLMPTGMLSLLPIHCAGPCTPGQPGMYDFITSYTTTLSSLISARRIGPAMRRSGAKPRMLAVAQSRVEGYPALRCAEREIDELLQSSFAPNITFVSATEATASLLQTELPHHDWLHCCSHATWNSSDPLQSAFCLKDGKLTLADVVRLHLQNAEFAFLSACHTARETSLLPNESMHLAAGMQVAGFRGVVATQWAMADQDGPALTRMFYDYLNLDGREAEARNAAEALHLALRQFRLRNIPMYRWALFVHVGV